MKHVDEGAPAQVVMPVSELHGRTVWTEAGERIGVVRGVHQDDDGRIVALDVRERWMLGAHHEVPASGMRLEGGDVIVPATAMARTHDDDDADDVSAARRDRVVERRPIGGFSPAPVLLAGREGARGRFGGLDIVGSLFGALVTIASLVLVGGLLAAIFSADPAAFDTSLDSLEAITTEAMVVGAVTLFVACFLGGWAAGRSARFDGAANGLMSVTLVLAIGVAFAALGAWLGDEYDVFANVDMPSFVTDEFTLWGSVALAAALVLMLLGGALGGALGESWHRRADRAMMDVVSVDDDVSDSTGIVGSPVEAQRVDDSDAYADDSFVDDHPADRRPR